MKWLEGQRMYLSDTRHRRAEVLVKEFVDRANALEIQTVLSDFFGLDVPKMSERSFKIDCPFAFEHPDGGLDKNCRVYGTTHLYCFAMHGSLTPVRLMQIKTDSRPAKAAQKLLEFYDLARPRPWRERRERLLVERAAARSAIGNTVDLVEALHVSLQSHPKYEQAEFGERFVAALEAELEGLDALLGKKGVDGEEVRRWYEGARRRLSAVLDREGESDEE